MIPRTEQQVDPTKSYVDYAANNPSSAVGSVSTSAFIVSSMWNKNFPKTGRLTVPFGFRNLIGNPRLTQYRGLNTAGRGGIIRKSLRAIFKSGFSMSKGVKSGLGTLMMTGSPVLSVIAGAVGATGGLSRFEFMRNGPLSIFTEEGPFSVLNTEKRLTKILGENAFSRNPSRYFKVQKEIKRLITFKRYYKNEINLLKKESKIEDLISYKNQLKDLNKQLGKNVLGIYKTGLYRDAAKLFEAGYQYSGENIAQEIDFFKQKYSKYRNSFIFKNRKYTKKILATESKSMSRMFFAGKQVEKGFAEILRGKYKTILEGINLETPEGAGKFVKLLDEYGVEGSKELQKYKSILYEQEAIKADFVAKNKDLSKLGRNKRYKTLGTMLEKQVEKIKGTQKGRIASELAEADISRANIRGSVVKAGRALGLYMGASLAISALRFGLKGAINITQSARNLLSDMRNMNLGGNVVNTQEASTQRQRALQALQNSTLNARQFIGREAYLLHS